LEGSATVKPLCVELFCGSMGWSAGWLALGGRAIGFDLEHLPHHGPVPAGAELVLQDVLTLHGSQFRSADLILASPPCQRYSYMAMPWTRSKALAAAYREHIGDLNDLFNACFRLQLEASQAAGRYIPMVVENVKGAQPWVEPAKAHFGSYYLWGDVESAGGAIVAGPVRFGEVLRARKGRKSTVGSWDLTRDNYTPDHSWQDGVKVGDVGWRRDGKGGENHCFQGAAADAIKNSGGSWFGIAHNTESGCSQNPVTGEGVKQHGSGAEWFDNGLRKASSKSDSRKAASAQIARIPYALSEHIARCYWPSSAERIA
jgi:hypothetical protein